MKNKIKKKGQRRIDSLAPRFDLFTVYKHAHSCHNHNEKCYKKKDKAKNISKRQQKQK